MCLAIPGRIKSIEEKDGHMRTGKADLAGIIKEINLELVPDAKVNDYVLIHVGVALSIVNEEEANKSLRYLEQMNELDELYNSSEEELTQEEIKKQGMLLFQKYIQTIRGTQTGKYLFKHAQLLSLY